MVVKIVIKALDKPVLEHKELLSQLFVDRRDQLVSMKFTLQLALTLSTQCANLLKP